MPVIQLPSNQFMRKYLLLILVCTVLGISFFVYIHYSQIGQLPSLKNQADHYLLSIVITNLIGFFVLKTDNLLDKLIHWRNHFLFRFLAGFLVNLVLAV